MSPEAESPPLTNVVEQQRQNLEEVRELLAQRHQHREEVRAARNAEMNRQSTGTQAKVGDLLLVKEADSSLAHERAPAKLVHDLWTGPWVVQQVVIPGLSLKVKMPGRKIRERTVSAANVKKFHVRPTHLRHPFPDEYSQFVWGVDLGLAITSTPPLYTLTDRKVVLGSGSSWVWEYRGLFHDGAESHWLSEEEVLDSFTGLQLDVFHALWELYNPQVRPRPSDTLSRAERDSIARDEALRQIPRGTKVRKQFEDSQGKLREFEGVVFDFRRPFYRIKYGDGDWEEMTRLELREHVVETEDAGAVHGSRTTFN